MAPTAITNLPLEIICQIFQNLGDFSSINALARTSQAFYTMWFTNSPSIFHTVAVRALPNFSDAERLVDTQEEAYCTLTHPDTPSPNPYSFSRHGSFLYNARCASAACKHWDEICQVHQLDRARGPDNNNLALRPSERARFKKSFYHLWTLCTLCNIPSLQPRAHEFLDACTPIELAGLDEIATWANGYNENEFGDCGLDFEDGTWKAGFVVVGRYCGWERKEKSGHRRVGVSGDEAPLGFWVFFDHTQKYLEQISAHW